MFQQQIYRVTCTVIKLIINYSSTRPICIGVIYVFNMSAGEECTNWRGVNERRVVNNKTTNAARVNNATVVSKFEP